VGNTTGDIGLFKLKRLQNTDKNSNQDSLGSGLCNPGSEVMDGSAKDNVWGTYIHGIFDNNGLRTALINSLRMKKGLQPRESTINYAAEKEKAIDRWADILKSKVDICYMLRQVGMDACMKNFTKGLKCATKKL
jgi:cobyric acid synthase